MIAPEVRRELLALARSALEAKVRGVPRPGATGDLTVRASGVFVTIHCAGELRGCLGSLDLRECLGEAVARLGADVSDQDDRFRPLAPHELGAVTIDLSVLTPPERVSDPSAIQVGRDGLIVQQGNRRGLLLPQVATEHGWDRETFLAQTCIKAGLAGDAWQRAAEIFRFEAEVFGEVERARER